MLDRDEDPFATTGLTGELADRIDFNVAHKATAARRFCASTAPPEVAAALSSLAWLEAMVAAVSEAALAASAVAVATAASAAAAAAAAAEGGVGGGLLETSEAADEKSAGTTDVAWSTKEKRS